MPDADASPGRRCIRCLLRELAERDEQDIGRYVSAIRERDRADEGTVERRLAICMGCEKLVGATCTSCGCYAEFRAAMRDGRCPRKKW